MESTRSPPGVQAESKWSPSRVQVESTRSPPRVLMGSKWKTTQFIVDSYHYINHHTTDYLCHKWCNPAPLNGSAPNLVIVENDVNGNPHYKHGFNSQACEQLNAWIGGFKDILNRMTIDNHMVSTRSWHRVRKESTWTYLEFTRTPGGPVEECKLQLLKAMHRSPSTSLSWSSCQSMESSIGFTRHESWCPMSWTMSN